MTTENNEVVSVLRELTSKFDALRQDVDRLRNDAHLKARRRYPLPKVPATRTPQLDGFIKGEVSMATRNADKELARLQSLVLDSLAPLTHLLEAEQRGGPPMWEEAKKAVVAATECVGNASAKMTHLRREKVITDLNKALLPVAKEATNFQTALPSLFGTEFAKKAKDHIDQQGGGYQQFQRGGARSSYRPSYKGNWKPELPKN